MSVSHRLFRQAKSARVYGHKILEKEVGLLARHKVLYLSSYYYIRPHTTKHVSSHRWFYLDETKLQYFQSETSPNSSTRTPIYTISMVFFMHAYVNTQAYSIYVCPHTVLIPLYMCPHYLCVFLTDFFFLTDQYKALLQESEECPQNRNSDKPLQALRYMCHHTLIYIKYIVV